MSFDRQKIVISGRKPHTIHLLINHFLEPHLSNIKGNTLLEQTQTWALLVQISKKSIKTTLCGKLNGHLFFRWGLIFPKKIRSNQYWWPNKRWGKNLINKKILLQCNRQGRQAYLLLFLLVQWKWLKGLIWLFLFRVDLSSLTWNEQRALQSIQPYWFFTHFRHISLHCNYNIQITIRY